jgi:glycine cleavage system H protein
METSENCRYTKEHEWAQEIDGKIRVGITDYAQVELGDVVFIELPEVGSEVTAGGSFAAVESVKAASDVYCPVDGKVVAVNENLNDSPELVNSSPYENGWFIEVEPSDAAALENLMDPAAYTAYIEEISK